MNRNGRVWCANPCLGVGARGHHDVRHSRVFLVVLDDGHGTVSPVHFPHSDSTVGVARDEPLAVRGPLRDAHLVPLVHASVLVDAPVGHGVTTHEFETVRKKARVNETNFFIHLLSIF